MMFENYLIELQGLFNVLLSAILGCIIGFERKQRLKEAGIRTHTVVCLGSALMMIVSKYGFLDLGSVGDPGRIAAQIVTGIGFLGAGMIVYKRRAIYGLTTAAGVWTTAGIGMACGAGLYVVSVGATILLVAVQFFFHSRFKLFKTNKAFELKISFINVENEHEQIKNLFGVEHFKKLTITNKEESVVYTVTLNTEEEFKSERLCKIMNENKYILSIERCVEE